MGTRRGKISQGKWDMIDVQVWEYTVVEYRSIPESESRREWSVHMDSGMICKQTDRSTDRPTWKMDLLILSPYMDIVPEARTHGIVVYINLHATSSGYLDLEPFDQQLPPSCKANRTTTISHIKLQTSRWYYRVLPDCHPSYHYWLV